MTKQKVILTIKAFVFGIALYIGCALLFVGSGIGHSYIVKQNAQTASKTLTVRKADKNKKKVIKINPITKAKVYQDVSFNQILTIFTTVWGILMVMILIKVWMPHHKIGRI